MQKINETLIKMLDTEKGMKLKEMHNYIFVVDQKASKNKVKDSVEQEFKVEVVDVNQVIMPGKKKRIGKTHKFRKTAAYKKAIVTLKKGQKIEIKEAKETKSKKKKSEVKKND